MKIRIKGNSIRYRLTRPEVERFAAEGLISEGTNFGDRALRYVLKRGGEHICAEFNNDTITAYLPAAMAEEWTDTDRVGFSATDNQLQVFIEKDFQCLDNVAEDQSDNYPNPLAQHQL